LTQKIENELYADKEKHITLDAIKKDRDLKRKALGDEIFSLMSSPINSSNLQLLLRILFRKTMEIQMPLRTISKKVFPNDFVKKLKN
jgi:hypothetical protein